MPACGDIIDALVQKVLESKKNLNDILKLQNFVNSADDIASTLAVHGLLRIYKSFIAGDDMKLAGSLASENDPKLVAAAWLRSNYRLFVSSLLEKISDKTGSTDRIKMASLRACMELVNAESVQKATQDKTFAFANDTYQKLFKACLNSTTCLKLLSELYLEQYDDLRFYTLKDLPKIAQEHPELVHAVYSLMTEFQPFEDGAKMRLFINVETRQDKGTPLLNYKSQRKVYSDAWIAVLRMPLTVEMYKTVLSIMNDQIIPHLADARLLHDFLTDCYNQGGAMSLLALQGLFSLIHKFNLDYPDFYVKLYALFDESVLHMKYRTKFLKLTDVFLKSSHLPAYLIAAFVKRMARLCLDAPVGAVIAVLPLIHNLLRRHASCHKLLQRDLEFSTNSQNITEQMVMDPYIFSEADPSKSNALESSLWELLVLRDHFHPKVVEIVRKFRIIYGKNQFAFELNDYIPANYDSVIDEDLEKKTTKAPRLAYEKPTGSFHVPGGLVDAMWV